MAEGVLDQGCIAHPDCAFLPASESDAAMPCVGSSEIADQVSALWLRDPA